MATSTGKIQYIKDPDTNGIVLPVTHERGVVDSSGVNLQTKLAQKIGSDDIDNVVELTQAQYDALSTKDSRTMYITTDSTVPSDHVGVASIVQTTTSSADGGTNVVTCTLTNNQTSTFQIKNGNQGNSGYTGAAGELEVVNNLTQGGATAALSAEMGKTLEGEISQLGLEVDIDEQTVYNELRNKDNGRFQLISGRYDTTGVAVGSVYTPVYYESVGTTLCAILDAVPGAVYEYSLSGNNAARRGLVFLDANNVVQWIFVTTKGYNNRRFVCPADARWIVVNHIIDTEEVADPHIQIIARPEAELIAESVRKGGSPDVVISQRTYSNYWDIRNSISSTSHKCIWEYAENTSPSLATFYTSAALICNPGDKFTVNVTGTTSAARSYFFLDGNNTLLEWATLATYQKELTAPANARMLVLQDKSGSTSYIGEAKKVLVIGDSWGRDTAAYVWPIAHDAGINRVIIGQSYQGGNGLYNQYKGMDDATLTYTHGDFEQYVQGTYQMWTYMSETPVKEPGDAVYQNGKCGVFDGTAYGKDSNSNWVGQTLAQCLASQDWDVIIIRCAWSDLLNINTLTTNDATHARFDILDFISRCEQELTQASLAKVKWGISSTWTYPSGCTRTDVNRYVLEYFDVADTAAFAALSQATRDAGFVASVPIVHENFQLLAKHMGNKCAFMIDTASGIEAARKSPTVDYVGFKQIRTSADTHLADGVPKYICGSMFVSNVFKKSINEIKGDYIPSGSTESDCAAARKCAAYGDLIINQ